MKEKAFVRYAIALHKADGDIPRAIRFAKRKKEWKDTPEVVKALSALLSPSKRPQVTPENAGKRFRRVLRGIKKVNADT